MTRQEFEQAIEKGYLQLPAWVQDKIRNVAVLVENEPSKEVREREGLGEDETLLGYYQGIPLTERGEQYGIGIVMPDTITLYQRSIERAALEDGLPIETVIADTIWHEFAHYFGMNEHEVRSLEYQRGIGDHRKKE